MRVDLRAPAWATHLYSDLGDWRKAPLPVSEMRPFDLPDDVYFEYAWRDAAGDLQPDPDNHNPGLNPWWPHASHLTGPDYRPDPYSLVGAVRPRGRVLSLDLPSSILEQKRRLMIYSPPGLADAALPVVLYQDGKAYYGWGKVAQVFDRLHAEGGIEPAHLVFIPPIERTAEYAFNPDFRAFLLQEALPFAEERARCNGKRISWGASLGGLLASMLAWERPDLFQSVVAQSAAYLFSEDMDRTNPYAGGESFRDTVLTNEPRPIRWHLQCGSLEWLLGCNERLRDALAERDHDVELVIRAAGHNWVNWRNGLADGLRFALGTGN